MIDDEEESLGNRLKAAQIMVDWSLKQTERDIKNNAGNQERPSIETQAKRIEELMQELRIELPPLDASHLDEESRT